MAIVTLPASVAIQKVVWDIDQPAQVNRSRWTGRRQVVTQPGPAIITATADLVVAIGERAALEGQAFIIDLEGPVNSFRLGASENAQILTAGQEVIDGGGQTGRTLNLRGGLPNTGLRRGHKLTVGDQMVFVMAPFLFGADGKATVSFKPSLRVSPADGDPVELRWPTAMMALAGSQVGWSVDPGQLYQIKQLQLEEAF